MVFCEHFIFVPVGYTRISQDNCSWISKIRAIEPKLWIKMWSNYKTQTKNYIIVKTEQFKKKKYFSTFSQVINKWMEFNNPLLDNITILYIQVLLQKTKPIYLIQTSPVLGRIVQVQLCGVCQSYSCRWLISGQILQLLVTGAAASHMISQYGRNTFMNLVIFCRVFYYLV